MVAKMKHLAIVSEKGDLVSDFYKSVFGMKSLGRSRPSGAIAVRDGYVGLNINPRKPGRQAGLDHFGFEVEELEGVYARMREKYSAIETLKRPSNRPFAGISTHDPAGNVFDLSQKAMENRTDVYVEAERKQDRQVSHFALRTLDPTSVAVFYRDVFELTEKEKPADDPNFYLTDGKVTLIVCPWKITDYKGTGIERPALDHIGFKVESMHAVKKDLQAFRDRNPSHSPTIKADEQEARLKLFSRCSYGQFQFSDPDGVLIDVAEGKDS
ncbi:MAG: VOC family protein [Candidatus Binatia bacterium]